VEERTLLSIGYKENIRDTAYSRELIMQNRKRNYSHIWWRREHCSLSGIRKIVEIQHIHVKLLCKIEKKKQWPHLVEERTLLSIRYRENIRDTAYLRDIIMQNRKKKQWPHFVEERKLLSIRYWEYIRYTAYSRVLIMRNQKKKQWPHLVEERKLLSIQYRENIRDTGYSRELIMQNRKRNYSHIWWRREHCSLSGIRKILEIQHIHVNLLCKIEKETIATFGGGENTALYRV